MKTLFTLFAEGRADLQAAVEQASNLDEVVKLIHQRLHRLQTTYLNQLSVAQARLAASFLEVLRIAFTSLMAANKTALYYQQATQDRGPGRFPSRQILLPRLLQAGIFVGLFWWLFALTSTLLSAWIPLVLLMALAGLEGVILVGWPPSLRLPVIWKLLSRGDNPARHPPSTNAPLIIVRVEGKRLLDALAEALSLIDRVVAEVPPMPAVAPGPRLEDLPELLDLLHDLLGDSLLADAPTTMKRLKGLPRILHTLGIQVLTYPPAHQETAREYFDVEPSLDQTNSAYLNLVPALVQGDRVLRRGRVIAPAEIGADAHRTRNP